MTFNKKNLLPIFALTLLLGALASCKKDAEAAVELISESEAAEIIETSISDRSAGVTMPVEDATQIVAASLNNCNVPGDTSISKSNSSGAASYDYNFNLGWLVTCNGNIPQSAQVDIAAMGNFSSLNWAGSDATSGTLYYTGLSLQAPEYIVNGAYSLVGDITGTLRRISPSFNCITDLQLVDLTIDKSNFQITGGTGTAVVTATGTNGQARTLNGDLVFHGNGTVTVTVNGHSHTFSL